MATERRPDHPRRRGLAASPLRLRRDRLAAGRFPRLGNSQEGDGLKAGDYNGDGLTDVMKVGYKIFNRTAIDTRDAGLWINQGNGSFFPFRIAGAAPRPGPWTACASIAGWSSTTTPTDEANLIEELEAGRIWPVLQSGAAQPGVSGPTVSSTVAGDISVFNLVTNQVSPGSFSASTDIDGDGNRDLLGGAAPIMVVAATTDCCRVSRTVSAT